MTSASTFEKLGVVFGYEDGQAFFEARTGVVHDAVMAEIKRRCAMILPQLPLGPMQLARLTTDPRDAKRWGECMSCLEPMKPHVGGTCALCNAGLRMALKEYNVREGNGGETNERQDSRNT